MAVRHGQGDFIALIDDDELPIDNWLLNHYRFLCATRADGSLGPVLPHYEIEPPAWVIKGKFFDRPIHNSGQRLRWEETRSGNVLLKKDVINPNEIAFDPKFGSGGEDRDFFKRKIKQGRVFLWCAEAPVFENIPEVRWTKSFMLRRALLRGKKNVQAYTQSIRGIIKSLIAISVYTLALPIAFIFGYHIFLRTLIREFDHLGKIASLCGIDVTKERYII
jgi:succinoglycan biosynthesis protein ExoM